MFPTALDPIHSSTSSSGFPLDCVEPLVRPLKILKEGEVILEAAEPFCCAGGGRHTHGGAPLCAEVPSEILTGAEANRSSR